MNRESNTTIDRPARKSDKVIVPKKLANKDLNTSAEQVEGRALTKRNTREDARNQTPSWTDTMFRLARVRELAAQDKKQSFTQLMHHLTPEVLKQSFYSLKRGAAKGSDGIGWLEYQENLHEKLEELYIRIQSGRYKPKPSRRVFIPKADGSERPLSIQCIEDKLVQHSVVVILNHIYENDFFGFSYGFRPGKSQHDALDALGYGLCKTKVNWVLDLDIRKFFDTVEHTWLIQMIQYRVKDKRLVKLIIKWIKVGVVDEDGKRHPAQIGVPQGAVISPVLANIYLHYTFDLWSHQWRKKARGKINIIRYADDAVLCFQHQNEAIGYLEALKHRLEKFGLSVHPDKTKLIRFGRFALQACANEKCSKPETFDFLGFTHYCSTSRNGEFKLGRKTIKKRLRKQIMEVQQELRKRMHDPIGSTLKWLCQVLRGHINYYGVPGNSQQLSIFHYEIVRRWFKMLRRRSQRNNLTWEKFGPWVRRYLPKVRIVHPYPEQRFRAKYSR